MGCDLGACVTVKRGARDFNPRTHRGVRLVMVSECLVIFYFNPRTHRGVRQFELDTNLVDDYISIHAPIVGCDLVQEEVKTMEANFNPRTHRGVRRTLMSMSVNEVEEISIHAPIVGCDPNCNDLLNDNT